MLLAQYFECVDPVYPMVHRQSFYAEYEAFWALDKPEKDCYDAAFVALIFVMLALGTQFVPTSTGPKDRKQTAEFYASAGNQALRMSSYLSTATISSVQAMVLLVYFLINDNHASDGWAFAGIVMRQAYAMGLHRDPSIGKKRNRRSPRPRDGPKKRDRDKKKREKKKKKKKKKKNGIR